MKRLAALSPRILSLALTCVLAATSSASAQHHGGGGHHGGGMIGGGHHGGGMIGGSHHHGGFSGGGVISGGHHHGGGIISGGTRYYGGSGLSLFFGGGYPYYSSYGYRYPYYSSYGYSSGLYASPSYYTYSTPTVVQSPTVVQIPPQPAAPAFDNLPILILCPASNEQPVEYMLNEYPYSIKPGQSQRFIHDRDWLVTFSRGPGKEAVRYSLKPGVYRFRQTEIGWELFRANEQETVNVAPTVDAPAPPVNDDAAAGPKPVIVPDTPMPVQPAKPADATPAGSAGASPPDATSKLVIPAPPLPEGAVPVVPANP